MAAIGGNTPKFLQVAEPEKDTLLRIEVRNPHLVVVGEIVIEVRDDKVHVTSASSEGLEFVHHDGGPA